MFRPVPRTLLRRSATATQQFRPAQGRRFVNNSAQAEKSRSWRNSAIRWGLAAGAIYYYSTSPAFADVRSFTLQSSLPQEQDESSLPTIESVAAAKKRRAELSSARESGSESESESTQQQSTIAQRVAETESPASTPAAASATDAKAAPAASQSLDSSPGELEEEADQESAFNPETGEINWDCPCLGGMAHGPCGEEFRSAFSCFVYSTEEPKGMDCIDNFKGMQDCFRLHPDVYGSELDDNEIDDQLTENETGETPPETATAVTTSDDAASASSSSSPKDNLPAPEKTKQDVEKDLDPEDTVQAPREWHDATEKEKGEKKQ